MDIPAPPEPVASGSNAIDSFAMEVDSPMARPATSAPSQDLFPIRSSSLPLHTPEFTVGYVYSAEMLAHHHPSGHPEKPERISRIWEAFIRARLLPKMKRLTIRPVQKYEALLVHTEDLWNKVEEFQCGFSFLARFSLTGVIRV